MKSLGYLYIGEGKSFSSERKLSKKRLREIFGTGVELRAEITHRRRRFTIKGATARERKETGRKFEKRSSPKYKKKGRIVWL